MAMGGSRVRARRQRGGGTAALVNPGALTGAAVKGRRYPARDRPVRPLDRHPAMVFAGPVVVNDRSLGERSVDFAESAELQALRKTVGEITGRFGGAYYARKA